MLWALKVLLEAALSICMVMSPIVLVGVRIGTFMDEDVSFFNLVLNPVFQDTFSVWNLDWREMYFKAVTIFPVPRKIQWWVIPVNGFILKI